MKKILIVLITLLVLCGCSSGPTTTTISNGSDVFYETPDGKKVTKQEIYENAKKAEITDYLANSLSLKIAKIEGVDVDKLKEESVKYVEDMKAQGYIDLLSYYYGSEEAYITNNTTYNAVKELCKNNVNANFDTYVATYKPFKAEIGIFNTQEEAQKILDECNGDTKKFVETCEANEYQGEIEATVYNYYDNQLPDEVDEYVTKATKNGFSPIIKTQTVTTDSEGNSSATDRFYVVNLISKDVNDFKDEFVDYAAGEVDQDTIITNLINKYGVTCHDQDVFESLKAKYGEVIK